MKLFVFSIVGGGMWIALLVIGTGAATEPVGVPRPVRSVDSVWLSFTDAKPPQVQVSAEGTVTTGGWSHPALVLRHDSPKDGVYEFDFKAAPPSGAATQVMNTLKATYTFKEAPGDLRLVRVYAQTNHQEAVLERAKPRQ